MCGRNVLVAEADGGLAAADAQALADDGDYVFHCFPQRWGRGERANPFLCIGVTEGACPLDTGIDVAVVRDHGEVPSIFSAGALCAMRRGIPVATIGDHADVLTACDVAVEAGYLAMRLEIQWRLAPILTEAGLRHDAVSISFEPLGPEVRVWLVGPPLDAATKQRLAVRVADGIRAANRSYKKTTIVYEEI